MVHNGSCHCGKVTFSVEGDIQQVMECNCSHCRRKGYLLWFIPVDRLGNPLAAINVRCLPEVELASLKVVPVDGRSL